MTRFPRPRTPAAGLLALAATAALMTGCATSTASGSTDAGSVRIVGYSTPKAAYGKITSAFKGTDAGKGVSFTESYGASGDQSRAVESGQKADYVTFSQETDMTRLVNAGIVAETWADNPHKGMVTDSVVVFAVRKGNPKGIKTWADLLKPGVEVVTPNPFSSGSARWNIMAGYGTASDQGNAKAKGVTYLEDLFKHVVVQDSSGAKALATFVGGKGDVLLTYENEAIFARQQGQELDYVVPDSTVLIENPAAVVKKPQDAKVAKAFHDFVYTKQAQQIFADNGYRPIVDGVRPSDAAISFPDPPGLFTIADLGGWKAVTDTFFDPDKGVMARIEESIGVSVDKS